MLAAFTLVGARNGGASPIIRWMSRDGKTVNVDDALIPDPIAVISFIWATCHGLARAARRRAVVARSSLAAKS
jgi:hypothetical protein